MITAVIPISPIKSHPGVEILTETVDSIRFHHPDAEIFLTFDGIRPEHEHHRRNYEQHINTALELADHTWQNCVPYIFDTHHHQTGMLRNILGDIRTPLILYTEQDTPLVTDEPIDWPAITHALNNGTSNLTRFYHEATVPKPHRHLMHHHTGPLLATSQWSQRPHLATTAYYRRILDAHFTPDAKAFIEDKMHSVVQDAFNIDGIQGWQQHRLHIYDPGNGNMKRSYHLDGRAGEPKYDDTQTF